MDRKLWTRTPVVLLTTFICCFLWGSAFPSVKIGYALFSVASDDTAAQLLFAGLRFFLAGVLVILFGSIGAKRLLRPKRSSAKPILLLALIQTIAQYYFFYVGLAHTSGVKSSIIIASNTFFSILIAALIFRYEKLTSVKIIGCLIGFAGVVLIQLPGNAIDLHLQLNGEGFVLFSSIMYALSTSIIKHYSGTEDVVMLSGYQFALGGFVLALIGAAMGGRLGDPSGSSLISGVPPVALLLLLYMALISAVAYTLWGLLLRHNPVSRIAMFAFMNPVIGVILSALLLGEQNQAFSIYGLLSLVLVSLGIIIVYRVPAGEV